MYRPQSIVRLILIGFAVVLAPLITAVVTAVVQVDRLARDSQVLVLEAEVATQQSRSLVEQLTQMQRALGLYRALGDEGSYPEYLERRAAFRNALGNLRELSLTGAGREHLEALEREERALYEQVQREAAGAVEPLADELLNERWSALAARARNVLTESSRLIEAQANSATRSADRVQRTLLLQAAAVIPATLFLAGVFVVLINRPMRQVGEAIRRLGARDFTTPVRVEGPRDVEQLGAQLDWLRRRITELEQQKVSFVRHISHELKTPLTTIREGAELLAESLADASPEEAEISRIMRGDSVRLQRLIEDLLQFGKTQELVTDLKVAERVDLRGEVSAVIQSQRVACGAKDVRLVEALAEVAVRADPHKVRTVVDNLVTNAVKYTPDGGEIRVTLDSDGEFARVDVEDSGPGIAPDERARIFEPFYQGRAEYRSSVKGTGLGLAIAKEYSEAHGGTLEVLESTGGAHFRARFPLAGPRRPATPAAPERPVPATLVQREAS